MKAGVGQPGMNEPRAVEARQEHGKASAPLKSSDRKCRGLGSHLGA
jgi:hypothetical protein